jgi:hypothetical protein
LSTIEGSSAPVYFNEEALKRGVASVTHPVTRALSAAPVPVVRRVRHDAPENVERERQDRRG